MFKRYDDATHWGLFIPISRRRWMTVWHPSEDILVNGYYRMYLCVTLKVTNLKILREYRLRIGRQFLLA